MIESDKPLAERLRPKKIDKFVGQQHLIGENGVLKQILKNKTLPSIIFWGPPGVGKTTLAILLAKELDRQFETISAVDSGIKEVREFIKKSEQKNLFDRTQPILFIDEIHRFSKSQQDSLLGAIEKGTIILIGATTENPSFEVIPALLSRCQIYILKQLTKKELNYIIDYALEHDVVLKEKNIQFKEREAILLYSGGDGRKLLNILEIVTHIIGNEPITNSKVKEILQNNPTHYDKLGQMHYDIISAFIKSIRGSDPNAAIYWLARMLEGGENINFIARRMIISASEDIGLANPTALVIANSCFQSVNIVGMPEAQIILSQTAIYLATSPKSNASYISIQQARKFVKDSEPYNVPLHLKNAPTQLMKDLNYGKNYKYNHDFLNNFVPQEYLPKEILGTIFYVPQNNDKENKIKEQFKHLWSHYYNYE